MKALENIFRGTLNIRVDADMQLGRLESLNSVNVSVVYRENFLANFLKQELQRKKECQRKTQICQLFI